MPILSKNGLIGELSKNISVHVAPIFRQTNKIQESKLNKDLGVVRPIQQVWQLIVP
jgi:hypothetical protein